MNLLIADSGSTKTDWCVLCDNGKAPVFLHSRGLNPYYQTQDEMTQALGEELLPQLQAESLTVDAVCFYGAGCTPDKADGVRQVLARLLHLSLEATTADSDMLGVARALCGHQPGIACILGTGSNSCLYDGVRITDNVPSLGFILGDEGSGATLGRLLVANLLKRQLPAHVSRLFTDEYHLTQADIMERVYRQPFPNRFLASLSPFLAAHLDEPALKELVVDSFRTFLRRNVLAYDGCRQLPVHFCGSVAWHYREALAEALQAERLTLGEILKSPMEGLVRFHQDSFAE